MSLYNTDWTNVYATNNVNTAYDMFDQIIEEKFKLCFPLRIPSHTRAKKNNKLWITPAISKSINTKCKLYKKWIKSKKIKDEIKYKNFAKLLRKVLNKAEKDYYSNLFDTRANNTKSICKVLINYLIDRALNVILLTVL